MSNKSFKTYPANSYASSVNAHYGVPLISWFRNSGQPSEYPAAFRADIGDNHHFDVNVDPNSYNYVRNKTDPFWPQEGDFDKGFSLHTPNSRDHIQFNYKISGGVGPWMPCPIFRSIGWYLSKETNVPSAWYPKHIALVLKNWKTDEEKTWAAGLTNRDGSSRVILVNVPSSVNHVRALGPDWFVYGVIFNLVSPATSSSYVADSRIVDFRLGYECNGLTGTNKLILPKHQSWNNLTTALRSGQMKYEPANAAQLSQSPASIDTFRCNPSTIQYGDTYTVEWNVSNANVVKLKAQDGNEISRNHSGTISYSSSTPGTYYFTLEATGSDGIKQIRQTPVTTKDPPLPTNSLTGPSTSTYGSLYTLNYTQSNHTTGEIAGTTVNSSSGSISFRRYPYRPNTSYSHVMTSTNSYGSTSTTKFVDVPGKSISPVSINGVPSDGNAKKKGEFKVYPVWSNTGYLTNITLSWQLEAGIGSGFANFNGASAGRAGQFTSDELNPTIYIINNTHTNGGSPVTQPPGRLPDGVKLKLTVTNDDNGESETASVMFKTYPK